MSPLVQPEIVSNYIYIVLIDSWTMNGPCSHLNSFPEQQKWEHQINAADDGTEVTHEWKKEKKLPRKATFYITPRWNMMCLVSHLLFFTQSWCTLKFWSLKQKISPRYLKLINIPFWLPSSAGNSKWLLQGKICECIHYLAFHWTFRGRSYLITLTNTRFRQLSFQIIPSLCIISIRLHLAAWLQL